MSSDPTPSEGTPAASHFVLREKGSSPQALRAAVAFRSIGR